MNRIGKLLTASVLLTWPALAQNYILQTVAGHSLSVEGAPATQDYLRGPEGIAIDSAGNVYFSDSEDNRVWKIDTTGKATTYAGNGVASFGGDGKAATAANLNYPADLALDAANNLYILDSENVRIRMVTPQGIITTVAGNGNPTSSGDMGPATSAGMLPVSLAVDRAGDIFIAEYTANTYTVRKVSAATQIITTFAGGGNLVQANNVPATSAELDFTTGLAVDPAGNVYIADALDCVIRKVNTGNIISTAFGAGSCVASGDGGQATAAGVVPGYLALNSSASSLMFGDQDANTVRQINLSTGTISTIAGTGSYSFSGDGGPATSATFNDIFQINLDSAGNLYLCDSLNHRVRKIAASNNTVNTIAGTSVNDGPATSAFLNQPQAIAFDSTGKLNIADSLNGLARQLNVSTGIISSDPGTFSYPESIGADSSGNVYVGSDDSRVYKIQQTGAMTVFAGNGTLGYSGVGGTANKASIGNITGIAADSAGNVYLADNYNHVLYRVDISGNITVIAGKQGQPAYSGEGGPAASATLDPSDVAIDKTGNIYVADSINARILEFEPGGNIVTVAGTGTYGDSGDGGPATQATLLFPSGIAVDNAGNLYISMRTLRKVTNGTIQTIAGNGTTYPFNGDGPATMVNVYVAGVAISSTGAVYICDYANDRIRELIADSPASLSIVNGNNQTGTAGLPLAQPLVVKVTGSDGNPYAGATVTFSAANNAVTFNPASAVSAADGTASTIVSLGSAAGPVSVIATVTGIAPVAFTLTAAAAASLPQISSGGVVSGGLSIPPIQVASPNAILSIFGQNFAPAGTSRQVASGDLVNGLVPTNLIGVCVMFGTQPAPMFLITPNQLNVQAPQLPASGSVSVQVITNCGMANQVVSNSVSVPVQAAAPEFFYAASTPAGKNPVAATDGVTLAGVGDPSRLGAGFALGYPGEVVVIYATGLGLSTPPYGPGALPPAATPVSNVSLSLDGTPVAPSAIQYVGVTPLLAGVYQLNLQLPTGLMPGDHTITISLNGVSSPTGPYISTGPLAQ